MKEQRFNKYHSSDDGLGRVRLENVLVFYCRIHVKTNEVIDSVLKKCNRKSVIDLKPQQINV